MTTDPGSDETPIPLLDVNVLVALAWPNHVHHRRAQQWFGSRAGLPWATTLITELGFVRLSSNTAVTGTPTLVTEALGVLGRIRAVEGHQYVEDHSSLLQPAVDLAGITSGRQTTDAHLVNLCAESGCVLATLDRSISTVLAAQDRRYVHLLP